MKRLFSAANKLRSRRGETIAEVLCAILIAGLSVALLAEMIDISSRMNLSAEQRDDAYYAALSKAETGVPADTGEVTVHIGSTDTSFPVQYCGESGSLNSYKRGTP